ELAVGKIDDVHHPPDEGEPGREQRVDRAEQQAADDDLQQDHGHEAAGFPSPRERSERRGGVRGGGRLGPCSALVRLKARAVCRVSFEPARRAAESVVSAFAAHPADMHYGAGEAWSLKNVSDFDLSGRVAIVTGGNGGIGLGMADALARAGCAVSIWGRNREKNERALKQLRAHGGAVEARICDVSDRTAVEAAFKSSLAEFGRVDACFANAGIGGGGRRSFVERSEEEWRRMFATNLDSVFHVFQVAARHMIERAERGDAFGRLIATSSTASIFGT